ncbi:MAG: low temperature requirement protein A [Polyangiaceae bacterium]
MTTPSSDDGDPVSASGPHAHGGAPQPARLGDLFRVRTPNGQHRVTFVELFFDLVFVFAVTQISHTLLGDFSVGGVLRASFLMLAVWWVWVFTSWATNWLDPERTPVRLLLFGLMVAGIALSMSIPEAFGARGLVFAVAYTGTQVGRTLFMYFAVRRADRALARNWERVLAWVVTPSALWILGGFAAGSTRVALFGAALGVEYLGPAVRFWVPRLGASDVREWSIEGGHLAERCALFVIIALGESLLVTGAAFAKTPWTAPSIGAFSAAFVAQIAMWWIYFDRGAEHGSELIRRSAVPGQLGRLAYTYLHLPIVASIVLTAVADELVLAVPLGGVDTARAIAFLGGPLLYLLGVQLFKYAIREMLQFSHLLGITLSLALLPFVKRLSPLALMSTTTAILLLVAVWESVSIRRGPLRSRKQRRADAEARRRAAEDAAPP